MDKSYGIRYGKVEEKTYFLKKFLRSPKKIGSITPSSPFLAQAMFKTVDWQSVQTIVELGAGTGVFTRQIHARKLNRCEAIIFECDDDMRRRLQRLYPDFHYYENAKNICADIRALGLTQVDCIISGLPFANFSQSLRNCILEGVVNSLKPGGQFIAFQYSLQMKKQLNERFKNVELSVVPLNLPPAFVYYCSN